MKTNDVIWREEFRVELSKNYNSNFTDAEIDNHWDSERIYYLAARKKAFEERDICTCKPMPHIDWCQNCTWKEHYLECDKNEVLQKEITSLKQQLKEKDDILKYKEDMIIIVRSKNDEIDTLKQELKREREAVDSLLEMQEDNCRLDHNGRCQEHYVESNCRVKIAQETQKQRKVEL